MAQDKERLVQEGVTEKMPAAPPDPDAGRDTAPDAPPPGQSGVADENPLSAHPT